MTEVWLSFGYELHTLPRATCRGPCGENVGGAFSDSRLRLKEFAEQPENLGIFRPLCRSQDGTFKSVLLTLGRRCYRVESVRLVNFIGRSRACKLLFECLMISFLQLYFLSITFSHLNNASVHVYPVGPGSELCKRSLWLRPTGS